MSNDDLERYVNAELEWDPKVDSDAVAVEAQDGKVTLRGTVGSFREKRDARKAAERVYGVTSVDNDLQVRLLSEHRRGDADLRGDVLRALMLDGRVPDTVDAKVEDSFVTLTGTAKFQFQRREAESVAGNVPGVLDVWNDIDLVSPTPDALDVKSAITDAFQRSARLDADDLRITTSNGTITLEGSVGSWVEHDEAVDAAWAAPGVRHVDDRIAVGY
jgi:osmotically-inducible protein OsmY